MYMTTYMYVTVSIIRHIIMYMYMMFCITDIYKTYIMYTIYPRACRSGGGGDDTRAGNCGLMSASAVLTSINNQVMGARPWSLMHMCSLDQWNNGHGGMSTAEPLEN